MCLEAAGKIPELIQTLIDRTREMRARIATKKNELDELGALLAELANSACDDGR
jgi:Sec-independent protein translocase protein TatA